ncbi:50S ribosomal protein L15 [Candidatus Uhrbacteria bacterium]|nr:50S ribosomal protein L15 [Candidatus Uhrbacteria bacterium]
MALTLNTIAPNKGARTKRFRIGRGEGSGRGKTAGRGTKGQRARTGGRKNLKLKGIKQMILGFPKNRGFQSKFTTVYSLPLKRVAEVYTATAKIDIRSLIAKGLLPKMAERAKLIGSAEVTSALTFVNIVASASAKAAIEKAGGTFLMKKIPKAKKLKDSKGKNQHKKN